MRQIINLFLGDMEVEFNQPPQILYTYTQDELMNPTVIRNSFSKSITIEGTKENNKIFGHFWNLERIQDYGAYNGVYFNASKKTPFTLFVNGEIYESGYAKLTEVRKEHNGIEYDIDLFGGLGSFFLGLTNNPETGNRLKLSDLDYRGTDNSETEFDFIINKDTVYDAWYTHSPYASENYLSHYINFVPAYNGYPSKNFDSNKILVNTKDNVIPTKADADGNILSDNSTKNVYDAYGNTYVLTESPSKLTEWEIGDIRAGFQRPCIRMKEIINACCRYMEREENGAWTINLDSEFFNQNNPYFEDSWVTLSQLSEMNYLNETEDASYNPDITLVKSTNEEYEITGVEGRFDTLTFSTRVSLPILTDYSQYDTLYLSQNVDYSPFSLQKTKKNYDGAIVITIDAVDELGNVIATSDCNYLTSRRNMSYNWDLVEGPIVKNKGVFEKKNGKYYWCTEDGKIADIVSTLSLQGRKFSRLLLNVKWVCNKNIGKNNNGVLYGTNKISRYSFNSSDVRVYNYAVSKQMIETAYVNAKNIESKPLSGTKFTKKILLDTSNTPCDYLLSYCKLFGLHFVKDVNSNTISILTRKNFYQRDNVIDLEQYIDRSKTINIHPTTFDKQWYEFKNQQVDSEFAKDYKSTTTYDFGTKRINTGYDFDGDVKDLFDGNVYKSGIESLEKSKYYSYTTGGKKPWMLDGLTYSLYKKTDSSDTVEEKMDAVPFEVNGINEYKYYDLFPKLQFHQEDNKSIDGSNVLVFFRGYVDCVSPNATEVNYWLTDDLDEMFILNGNNCWLSTNSEYNENNDKVAIKLTRLPVFGRYMLRGDLITQSLDFGEPRQLYVPNYITQESSTLYNNYWKSYIEDMYDVNTRVLDCYVRLENKPNPEWLSRFYWFDNCIWRINKISDWNVSDYSTTKMQFVKVQDINNYSNNVVSTIANLTLSADRYVISDKGGTVTFTVTVSDGGCWYAGDIWEYYFDTIPSGCGQSTTFSLYVPPYNDGRVLKLSVIGDRDQWSNAIEIKQIPVTFEVKQFAQYTNNDVPQSGGTCLYNVKSTYSWTVKSDRTYCISQTNSGTGNTEYGETIEVLWLPSDTYGTRNATLTFTDLAGNVIYAYKAQEGVNYYNLVYPYTGGTQTLYAPSGGTVSTKPEWIEIIDNGDGTYSVIAEYNSGDYRSGTIVLTYPFGKTFTVIAEQEEYKLGGASVISGNTAHLSVKQFAQYTNSNVPQSGGTCLYNVKSTTPWTVSCDRTYCIPQTNSGTGNTIYGETIEVLWPESDSYAPRNAILTFTNTEAYSVKASKWQDGLNYGELLYPYTGETKTIQYVEDAEIVAKPTWITVNYIGAGEYELIAGENDSYLRTGTVVLQKDDTLTIAVEQAEGPYAGIVKTFNINPSSLYFTPSGGTQYSNITNNMGDNWRILSFPNWLTVSPTQGSASAILSVTASENTGTDSRNGIITVFNATLNKSYEIICGQSSTQTIDERSITITPSPLNIGSNGGTSTVTINYMNRNGDFLIPETSGGVTVGNIVFTGNTANVDITVPENYTFTNRTFNILFKGDGIQQSLTINQEAATAYLEVEPINITFGNTGGTATITIRSNDTWNIQ